MVRALKHAGLLPRRVRLRQCKYLNNIIEQDHRSVKKRTWLAKGYGSFQSAWRTLEGIETVNMIRKGRVRWVAKGGVMAQAGSLISCSASPPSNASLIRPRSAVDLCSLKLRNGALNSACLVCGLRITESLQDGFRC